MNKLLKILISAIAAIIALGSFASVAFAQSVPLVVQFAPNPLFIKPNFLPLDETSGVVTVTNNSNSTQTILTEATNIIDNDNFGHLLHLKIVGNDGILFDNSLANFLSTPGEVSLGTISNGESKTFTYTISFIDSSDNSYQGKTLGFDVCVGFSGGTKNCGDTVIGGEGDTGSDAGTTGNGSNGGTVSGTGGGGGGSGSIHQLIIFNEKASNIYADGIIPESGQATITWNTNLLATSQVVYGLASGPHTFDLNVLPYFGYPSGTAEDSTKVILHSVQLSGLTPGATYVYRVVSRASPPTISYEHQFTVPFPSGIGATKPSAESAGGGSVLGASTGPSADGSATSSGDVLGANEVAGASGENNLAAVVTSSLGNILSVCQLWALLILLIGYLIWRLIFRPRYEREGLLEEEIKKRFCIFFGLFSALAAVIAFLLNQYCPIPIFLIALVLSLVLYIFNIINY